MTKNKTAKLTAQQGDVLLRKIDQLPDGAKSIKKNELVLAEGEVTGHAHRLRKPGAELFELESRLFVKLVDPATLTHEEHGPITLEPGIWEVGRVQEWHYLSQMARTVAD